MNFQYLEHLEVEFRNSNFKLKEEVPSVEEISTKKSSSYEEKAIDVNTSLEGLIIKELPEHLKYAFLQLEKEKPVIILAGLTELEEQRLMEILRKYKDAIAWSIDDLKGINPSICMHRILLEENAKTSIEHQRRLNPVMKEVVRKEVLKWLNVDFIYAISDNACTTRKKLINDAVNASWKSYNDASLKCHGVDCHCICLETLTLI